MKRIAAIAAITLSAACATLPAQAQQYPSKPIRIVVPYAAGGTSDILARQIGPKLTDAWGQPVIVENKPGANGNVGADFVAKSAEDLNISQGTADDLDDLALLLGYREYRVLEGKQNELVVGYVTDWRREFAECRENLTNYEKYLSWASGDQAVAYFGKALRCLEDVLSSLKQYKAVEIRLGTDFGLDKITLITYIE